MNKIYTPDLRKIMQANYDTTSMSSNRVEEILNFALGMSIKRLGIAYCITMQHEAHILEQYFSKHFDVFIVDCKYGRVTKQEILGGQGNRIMCNPAGQADFLNKHHTELNISMGLCVGHDMIFSKQSDGLVTNLFDKDFTNNNNPAKAISDIQRTLV